MNDKEILIMLMFFLMGIAAFLGSINQALESTVISFIWIGLLLMAALCIARLIFLVRRKRHRM